MNKSSTTCRIARRSVKSLRLAFVCAAAATLLGCGGNGSSQGSPATGAQASRAVSASSAPSDPSTVRVSVSGLGSNTIALRNNGADELLLTADGTFDFANPVASGATYAIEVVRQPESAGLLCYAEQSRGTVQANPVEIAVLCSTAFSVGGSVSGLVGSGLMLTTADGVALPIDRNGSFALPQKLRAGTSYRVSVGQEPRDPKQACSIQHGEGDAVRNVTDLRVQCVTTNALGSEYLVAPAAISATSTAIGFAAEAVTDYSKPSAVWRSGASAPQSLMLDLGSPRALTRVTFFGSHSATGSSHYIVHAGLHRDDMAAIGEFNRPVGDGERLTLDIGRDRARWARYVRIEVAQSPAQVALGKVQIEAAASNFPQYFGYYGDAFPWLTRATEEIAGHSNISWVSCEFGCPQEIVEGIRRAAANGMKAAVAIHESVHFDTEYRLRPDHAQQWAAFAAAIRPYAEHIAFIYPSDEPFAQARAAGHSAAAVKRDLETLGALIKQTFPNIPLAFTYSHGDVAGRDGVFSQLADPIPRYFDWFGFSCYGSFERCGDESIGSAQSVPEHIRLLRSKLRDDQKIFLFPDSFVRAAIPANPVADAAEAERRVHMAPKFAQLAFSNSAIVGVFPFLYQDDYIEWGQPFLGTRFWPALREAHAEIGRKVVSQAAGAAAN